MRVGRFLATFLILDSALLAVYLILFFTVFSEPTYAPFASGSVSTLVPEGSHSSAREGVWQRDSFTGKGNLVIRTRHVSRTDLGDLVKRARDEAARGKPQDGGFDLGGLVKRTMGQDSIPEDTLSAQVGRGENINRAFSEPGTTQARDLSRIEPGRTLIQLLASNTPNLRLTEEVPAFDSTIFCLGSVGRGQRWYRYLVQSGETIVDLSMYSPHSSHIVYKEALDKALMNLRIDGESSNHILAQAVAETSGRISPRWAQGNVFWLVFFVALPTGIMLILLLVFRLSGGRARPQGPGFGVPSH